MIAQKIPPATPILLIESVQMRNDAHSRSRHALCFAKRPVAVHEMLGARFVQREREVRRSNVRNTECRKILSQTPYFAIAPVVFEQVIFCHRKEHNLRVITQPVMAVKILRARETVVRIGCGNVERSEGNEGRRQAAGPARSITDMGNVYRERFDALRDGVAALHCQPACILYHRNKSMRIRARARAGEVTTNKGGER